MDDLRKEDQGRFLGRLSRICKSQGILPESQTQFSYGDIGDLICHSSHIDVECADGEVSVSHAGGDEGLEDVGRVVVGSELRSS